MLCKNCGEKISESDTVCPFCGELVEAETPAVEENIAGALGMARCEKCGYVGTLKPGKLLTKKELLIGIPLAIFGGIGVFYLIFAVLEKLFGNKRGAVCPVCGHIHKPESEKMTAEKLISKGKAVASNPEVRESIKSFRRSCKELSRSLDVH